jgi:hypothetical protein
MNTASLGARCAVKGLGTAGALMNLLASDAHDVRGSSGEPEVQEAWQARAPQEG